MDVEGHVVWGTWAGMILLSNTLLHCKEAGQLSVSLQHKFSNLLK